MNLESLKALAMSKVARQVLQTKKHSPTILFVAGAVGVVSATVLACRATLKVSDKLDMHEKMISDLGIGHHTALTEEERTRELRKLQVHTALEITKLYMLPAGLTIASIAALTGSHVVLSKRNGAIMAAYAGLDRAYKEYRQRVATEYGVDTDRRFALGGEEIAVEEKTSDGKTKMTLKETVPAAGKRGSAYAVLFDEKSHKFTREPGMNAIIVGMQQSYANDKLRANNHLFLNEVYDMLGLPRTRAGAVVGWVFDPKNEAHAGDNYVDFGIFEGDLERGEAFVNGEEGAIWLDFNVDGVIYDKI